MFRFSGILVERIALCSTPIGIAVVLIAGMLCGYGVLTIEYSGILVIG